MRNRLLLLALIVAIGAIAYLTGAYQYLAPDRLRDLLVGAGPWGPVLIVVLFSILEPFGTPGPIFLLAAATLWPFWLAFLVNWLGATGAGMFGFAFARFIGRDWVEDRMSERLRRWDDRLSQKGLRAVILFRLLFFLNPASHWALGLSRVPASTAFVGTMIGFAPGIALWSYYGNEIFVWLRARSISTWVAVAIGIALLIVLNRHRDRRQRRKLEVAEQ